MSAEESKKDLTTMVGLTNEEMLLLDGGCRPSIQEEVDRVKREQGVLQAFSSLGPLKAEFAARVAAKAMSNGILETSCVILAGLPCSCCDKKTRYAPHKRSGYYHQKGDPNYKKPIHVQGVHLVGGFVCLTCWADIKAPLISFLEENQTEIDTRFYYPDNNKQSRWKRSCNRECKGCGWTGHEAEMQFVRSGLYSPVRPKCPQCGVEDSSMYLGSKLVKTEGFVMVERPESQASRQ